METYNNKDEGLLVIRKIEDLELVGKVKIPKLTCFSVYKGDIIKVNGELYKVIDFSELVEHYTIIEKQILVEWIERIKEFVVEC